MTITGKSVIGLRVLTIDDGKQIETVDDIIYDPAIQKVKAMLVNSGGLFSKAKAIAMEDVVSIGKDAVMVQTVDVIKPVDELAERVQRIAEADNNLVKTRVVTQQGLELGQVSDIMFDPTSGNVEELIVSQGGVKNLSTGKKTIKPQDIITVGSDATIVSAYTEMAFDEQAEAGGAKGLLNKTKEKLAEVSEVVTEKAQETTEKVKALPDNPKVQDGIATLKEKTSDMKTGTQEKLDAVKDNPDNQEKLDTLKSKATDLKDTATAKVNGESAAASETKDQVVSTIPPTTVPETNVVHTVQIEKPEPITIVSSDPQINTPNSD